MVVAQIDQFHNIIENQKSKNNELKFKEKNFLLLKTQRKRKQREKRY